MSSFSRRLVKSSRKADLSPRWTYSAKHMRRGFIRATLPLPVMERIVKEVKER